MKHKPPIFIGLAVLCIIAIIAFDVRGILMELLAWVDGLGFLGPVVYIVLYVLATVLFVPGSILTLGAGFLFGVVQGTIIVSIAATLGAAFAFLLGRYFLRDWVREKVHGRRTFGAIDHAVGKQGWKIVFLTRLSPIFPFNLLNYAFGLTGVRFWPYALASWLGMLPGTVLYVYLGSLAGSFTQLGERGPGTTAEWTLFVVGLIATFAVVWYVTRVSQRALAEGLDEGMGKRL